MGQRLKEKKEKNKKKKEKKQKESDKKRECSSVIHGIVLVKNAKPKFRFPVLVPVVTWGLLPQ